MAHLLLFSTLLTLLQFGICIIQVAPTWQTSSYIQAGSNSIINGTSTTGASASPTPTATLTFANAFASVPNLAYGIPYYESICAVI